MTERPGVELDQPGGKGRTMEGVYSMETVWFCRTRE